MFVPQDRLEKRGWLKSESGSQGEGVRTGVARAGPILRDNHYGWFDRLKTGFYDLSAKGRRDLVHWSDASRHQEPDVHVSFKCIDVAEWRIFYACDGTAVVH